LVVSEFAGAALELTHAVHFNPFAVDELCEGIRLALEAESFRFL
jgi:trehalose-6-phosphate synthase